MRLLGPRPLEIPAADRAARALLEAFARSLDSGTPASALRAQADPLSEGDGRAPGLYLIVDDSGALRGFWATLSEAWLEDGPSGGRLVPVAKMLLDALTEEIWWERFPVAPKERGVWSPVVILEWPPVLADRSSLPPLGVPLPVTATVDEADEEGGGWLEVGREPVEEPRRQERASQEPPSPWGPWAKLPAERSLVCVLRGALRFTSMVHQGQYQLVWLGAPQGLPEQGWPLREWLEAAAQTEAPLPGAPLLGPPLQLPAGRVGFPIPGWLSRELEVQPAVPSEAAVGTLVPRDTRSRLFGQILLSASITCLLLVGTLAFSATTHWLALPRLEAQTPTVQVEAQPALSVCSSDHRNFVEQLRCQVRHLGAGGEPGTADCSGPDPGEDLQATYCGLRDREGEPDLARTAAAQACFEVLGGSFEYAKANQPQLADPERLLGQHELRVQSLVAITDELDAVCEDYRQRIEASVGGALLAAHVSGRSPEGSALQTLLFETAEAQTSDALRSCFESGRKAPLEAAQDLSQICGASPLAQGGTGAWAALGGKPTEDDMSALARYKRARFLGLEPTSNLWRCDRLLTAGQERAALRVRWDLYLPQPRTYGGRGLESQLALDALLLSLREDGLQTDSCWVEIDRMVAAYTPVHPLLGELPTGGWPSDQQQLCGQVCAAAYHVGRPPPRWVTPGADLGRCLDSQPPPAENPHRYHEGRLDALRLPWNEARDGSWVVPSSDDLCAFNLLAQDKLPGVLLPEVAPPLWAGELAGRTGLAGGTEGEAAAAAVALSKYGRNRSTATCSHVAAQCFTSELMALLRDERLGPHQWKDEWQRRIAQIPRRTSEELADKPWCRLVRPYISPDGKLPEGELDLPCALGIEETRTRMLAVIERVASGAFQSPQETP